MGAACVRADGDSMGSGFPKERSTNSYSRSSLDGLVALPSYTMQSNRGAASSTPLATEELRSAVLDFNSQLRNVGARAKVSLARYTRSLPKKPAYLRGTALDESAASSLRSQMFTDALCRSSVGASRRSIAAPTSATSLLARYS